MKTCLIWYSPPPMIPPIYRHSTISFHIPPIPDVKVYPWSGHQCTRHTLLVVTWVLVFWFVKFFFHFSFWPFALMLLCKPIGKPNKLLTTHHFNYTYYPCHLAMPISSFVIFKHKQPIDLLLCCGQNVSLSNATICRDQLYSLCSRTCCLPTKGWTTL